MSKPFRVLFASHSYLIGVNQAKLDAIARTGMAEIGLLVPESWPVGEWRRRFKIERAFSTIHYYPTKVFWAGRSGAYFYPPSSVRRAFLEFRPDIVQVEEEVFALSCFQMAVYARRFRRPMTVFCWENVDKSLSLPRRWTRRVVLQTTKHIVAGNTDAKGLVKAWGYTGETTVLPQLGVDTTLFSPRPRAASSNGVVIGYMGRLVHEKGIDLLLAAAQILRAREVKFRLEICGPGPSEIKLKDQSSKLGVADLVTWTGTVAHDEVPRVLSRMDALVLPSRSAGHWREQFGHVLIEAMAMGVPVIGSGCGEIPNVIGRPDAVFPEDDAPALAALLERVANDSAWRSELGAYGIARVAERYTHERIAKRLIEIWREVVDRDKNEVAAQECNDASRPVP